MDKKMLAAQLYTIRDYMKTPEEIYVSLKKIKDIGYDAVQVSGDTAVSPQEMKEMTDLFGLSICATHIPYERIINDSDRVINEHKLWNCRYAGLGSMPANYGKTKEGFLSFAKEFSVIAERFYKAGLKFIYHNHMFEFEKFDGMTGMDILLNETDPETFGFELDTYWIQAGGADPAEWIKKAGKRLEVVHFKDMAIKENRQIFAEIGNGNLDWDHIIAACRETGVKWYAIEQDICPGDPFDSLKISLEYLANK